MSRPESYWNREYWDDRYRNGGKSGDGSYGKAMMQKVDWLAALPGVWTISEIGCGDFNFGRHLTERLPFARYHGNDVSSEVIERNRKLYGLPRVQFAQESVPPADLLLCVDVLFHIENDVEYEFLLDTLKQKWTRYLAVSAYEYDGLRRYQVHIRRFEPAYFGIPILREVIEDDGQLFFYIFKR